MTPRSQGRERPQGSFESLVGQHACLRKPLLNVATPECPSKLQILKGFKPVSTRRGTVKPRNLSGASIGANLGSLTKAEFRLGVGDPKVKTIMRNGMVHAGLEFLLIIKGLTLLSRPNPVNGSGAHVVACRNTKQPMAVSVSRSGILTWQKATIAAMDLRHCSARLLESGLGTHSTHMDVAARHGERKNVACCSRPIVAPVRRMPLAKTACTQISHLKQVMLSLRPRDICRNWCGKRQPTALKP